MPSGKAVVIVDAVSRRPIMVVVPDHEYQLNDPSFNPPGTFHIHVPISGAIIESHAQLASVVNAAIRSMTSP